MNRSDSDDVNSDGRPIDINTGEIRESISANVPEGILTICGSEIGNPQALKIAIRGREKSVGVGTGPGVQIRSERVDIKFRESHLIVGFQVGKVSRPTRHDYLNQSGKIGRD